jgi:uncharacterized protein YwbE
MWVHDIACGENVRSGLTNVLQKADNHSGKLTEGSRPEMFTAPKSERVQLRLTRAERRLLTKLAKQREMSSISAYLRMLVLEDAKREGLE